MRSMTGMELPLKWRRKAQGFQLSWFSKSTGKENRLKNVDGIGSRRLRSTAGDSKVTEKGEGICIQRFTAFGLPLG